MDGDTAGIVIFDVSLYSPSNLHCIVVLTGRGVKTAANIRTTGCNGMHIRIIVIPPQVTCLKISREFIGYSRLAIGEEYNNQVTVCSGISGHSHEIGHEPGTNEVGSTVILFHGADCFPRCVHGIGLAGQVAVFIGNIGIVAGGHRIAIGQIGRTVPDIAIGIELDKADTVAGVGKYPIVESIQSIHSILRVGHSSNRCIGRMECNKSFRSIDNDGKRHACINSTI